MLIQIVISLFLLGHSFANEISTFVVNGTDADIENFPWQISLQLDGSHNCGGTLLNSRWVMCAVHCTNSPDFIKTNKIYIGSSNLNDYYQNPSKGYRIERVVNNPDYKGQDNDISLIKLNKPVKINNKTIKPACLLNENEKPIPYKTLVVTGFGETFNPKNKDVLQQSQNLEDTSFDENNRIKNENLITVQGQGTSACFGDSGGPLHTWKNLDSQKYVVGIVSKGDMFCHGLNIYTRVSRFLPWIKKTIDGDLCVGNLDDL